MTTAAISTLVVVALLLAGLGLERFASDVIVFPHWGFC